MTNPAPITTLYAGVLGLLFGGLSLHVALTRMLLRQSLGDGGNKPLLRAVRIHGNAAEYTPFLLLLVLLLELGGVGAAWLHGLGGAMVAGRILHAAGLSMRSSANNARRLGAVLSIGSTMTAAARVLMLGLGM